MEKLLNVDEVSAVLNVSKSSIYNYVQNQIIPCIKLNGRLLFSPDEIEKWIYSNKQEVKTNEAANETS